MEKMDTHRLLYNAIRFFALAVVLTLASVADAEDGSADDPLVFGIIPARSPEQVLAGFRPLVDAMERELGVSIRMRGAPDYETFLRRVLEGNVYDMILTGGDTLQYLRELDLYRPLAQMDGPGVFAVIAVQADSPFDTLEDLRGQATVATADLLAYSTGLGFRLLEDAGLDRKTDLDTVFVPSQSAALTVLVRGQVDASIIMVPVLRSAPPEMRGAIRILAETERAPPPAISVSTSMRSDLADRISEFLTSAKDLEPGSAVLQSMGWPGMTAVRIEDYSVLDWAADSIADRLKSLAE